MLSATQEWAEGNSKMSFRKNAIELYLRKRQMRRAKNKQSSYLKL